MATISAAGAGNWSAGGTWTGGAVPGDGDTAALGAYAVVMDIATIPAAGNLTGITATSGQLTIDMSATGLNGNATINCAYGGTPQDIQAGTTNTGILNMTVATTNTLTINGNLKSGAGATDYCLYITGTGSAPNIVVNGDVFGGGGTTAVAVFANVTGFSGTITINGSVTGGSGARANGVYSTPTATGTLTVTGNIIDGSGAAAIMFVNPVHWDAGTTNYYQDQDGNKYYKDIPAAANVRDNDTVAGVTGTMVTRTLSNANDTVAAGYYAATTLSAVDADLAVANIKSGVTVFGFAGEAAGGSGAINLDKMGAM